MKKYIVFVFIFLFSIFLSGCVKKEEHVSELQNIKNRGYLIVGVKTDSPPFGSFKDGKLQGIDIQLADNIAKAIFNTNDVTNKIEYVSVMPHNRISKLNSKEVDILVATMSINEKRKLVLDFSTPYYITSQKMLVRNDSSIKDLYYFSKKGKLGVIMGSTGEKVARTLLLNADVSGIKTYNEAYLALVDGKIDAILGDDCILSNINDARAKIINHAYSKELYAVAVRKNEDSSALLNIINPVITNMLDTKQIKLNR